MTDHMTTNNSDENPHWTDVVSEMDDFLKTCGFTSEDLEIDTTMVISGSLPNKPE